MEGFFIVGILFQGWKNCVLSDIPSDFIEILIMEYFSPVGFRSCTGE
jgi:hypothetical protein